MSSCGPKGKEGPPGEKYVADPEPEPDPEIEVDLEPEPEEEKEEELKEPEPEPEEDAPVCVQADERAPDCSICDRANHCELQFASKPETRMEPATREIALPIAIDGTVIPPIDIRAGQEITEQIYQERLDQARDGIRRQIEINPTKSLEMCAGAFLYARLVMVPKSLSAVETIQLVSEILTVYRELVEFGIVLREVTPPGTRVN